MGRDDQDLKWLITVIFQNSHKQKCNCFPRKAAINAIICVSLK
jgi:hypothetical protein